MRYVRIQNLTRGVSLADRAGLADTFWLRLRGLLGRPALGEGEGLLITPCRAVHMKGMKYAIDVAFLDLQGRVVAAISELKPGAKSGWQRGAKHALELPAGVLRETGTRVGDAVKIESPSTAPSAS
jgi:uncharacterized membrane protein (UPF0127 family)